jgi:hypothetical protein
MTIVPDTVLNNALQTSAVGCTETRPSGPQVIGVRSRRKSINASNSGRANRTSQWARNSRARPPLNPAMPLGKTGLSLP